MGFPGGFVSNWTFAGIEMRKLELKVLFETKTKARIEIDQSGIETNGQEASEATKLQSEKPAKPCSPTKPCREGEAQA